MRWLVDARFYLLARSQMWSENGWYSWLEKSRWLLQQLRVVYARPAFKSFSFELLKVLRFHFAYHPRFLLSQRISLLDLIEIQHSRAWELVSQMGSPLDL